LVFGILEPLQEPAARGFSRFSALFGRRLQCRRLGRRGHGAFVTCADGNEDHNHRGGGQSATSQKGEEKAAMPGLFFRGSRDDRFADGGWPFDGLGAHDGIHQMGRRHVQSGVQAGLEVGAQHFLSGPQPLDLGEQIRILRHPLFERLHLGFFKLAVEVGDDFVLLGVGVRHGFMGFEVKKWGAMHL
jgi:hypothetical protein